MAQFKIKLSYDRRSFGQSVLVSSHHLGLATNFYFSPRILSSGYCGFLYGSPSLTRGRVCSLLVHLLLGLASAVLSDPSHAELEAILYSLI
jgi:hypothetical protein